MTIRMVAVVAVRPAVTVRNVVVLIGVRVVVVAVRLIHVAV